MPRSTYPSVHCTIHIHFTPHDSYIALFIAGKAEVTIENDFGLLPNYTRPSRFSSCANNEFQCQSAQCLSMELRCDADNDCGDDEEDCALVNGEQKYRLLTKKTLLDLAVSVQVENILDINENDGIFRAKFKITLAWSDKRLTLKNLKIDSTVNELLPGMETYEL